MAECLQNLIVGSGPTAIAAAFALRRQGVPFEVVDVAYDLEPEREAIVRTLSNTSPSAWSPGHVETLFPPPITSAQVGVVKRFCFGSNFAYQQPEPLSCTATGCVVDMSCGLGGFGNVWAAASLPFTDHDLRDWPISPADLAQSYKNISEFVPLSAEADGLDEAFPLHQTATQLARSEQADKLLRALATRREALRSEGIAVGKSRLAVDASGGPSTCRYCGHCLAGCVYGSMFNPRPLWKQFEREGVRIHKGFYALEFQEGPANVILTAIDVRDGSVRRWNTSRLFLGTGAIGTTRLLARSLGLINTPIRIQEAQYCFFPLLSYRRAHDVSIRFTLAEVFVEILNPNVSRNYVHFQVYGLSEIFSQTIRAMIPPPFRRFLADALESRFYLFQGFIHSADSSHMELTITSAKATGDEVSIRGIERPASMGVARRAQALLRRNLSGFGLIPPLYLTMTPPGRNFHPGGSFPMQANHPIYTSDLLGRPAGLKKVHVLDAATFPTIPATTIAYPAMANADRVINETLRNGCLR